LSYTPITNTPSKVPNLVVFEHVHLPVQKSVTFHWSMHVDTDLYLLFEKWSKSLQDKCAKVYFILMTEKNTFWHP